MIPSDHFVKFYNEIFKYLERRGGDALDRYYARVADRQAYFTLDAFKRDGLKGMYDYWERIRIEENCDMTHEYNDTFYQPLSRLGGARHRDGGPLHGVRPRRARGAAVRVLGVPRQVARRGQV